MPKFSRLSIVFGRRNRYPVPESRRSAHHPNTGCLSTASSESRTVIRYLKTPVRIGRSSRRTSSNEDVLRQSRFAATIVFDCKAKPTRLDQAQQPSRIAYSQSAGCNRGVGNLRRHLSACYSRFAPDGPDYCRACCQEDSNCRHHGCI